MKKYLIPLIVLTALILHSCASVAPPKGGEKDEKKPYVTKTIPRHGTVQFHGNTVVYTFNKWIVENKLQQQLIISPEPKEFTTQIKKNQLIIKFDSGSFKANTTYFINLREGIKDLTEGNIADSTSLVFSTGTYLDSLSIVGNTALALENTKEADFTVALFQNTDTLNIEDDSPLYITKTAPGGNYSIQNIKPGKYALYSFKDENKNGRYDKNKEFIGFIQEEINLTSSLSGINILLSKEDHIKPKVQFKENRKKGIPKIEYNKNINKLNINNISNKNTFFPSLKDNIITIYPNLIQEQDTTRIVLTSTDLYGNKGEDTLGLLFTTIDTSRISIATIPSGGSLIEPREIIEIQYSKPYSKYYSNQIIVRSDNQIFTGEKLNDICLFEEDKLSNKVLIIPKVNWKDTVTVTVLPQSISPVSGYIKDTVKAIYTIKAAEQYGTIGGTVQSTEADLIIQLLTKDNQVKKEVFYTHNFLFEYLTEGEYKIRIIKDLNKNRKWDQGDFRVRKPMEPIHHYSEVIKLKQNWEILDLKIIF